MNSQGLYQAVRSRLHFSQIAAWWSRTNGCRPNYVATRIVPHNTGDDHLKKFRELPIEHTFPLAGLGDGNSVKVSMWALPRMEHIPSLHCPMHPQHSQTQHLPPPLPLSEELLVVNSCSRTTPSSKLTVPATLVSGGNSTLNLTQSGELLMPALLDDRLQITCDKPGKHHCHCAEEEDEEMEEIPRAPSLLQPTGERKRRRSLPCRPPEVSTAPEQPPLPAVLEAQVPPAVPSSEDLDGLARSFCSQVRIEEAQVRCEKRYKRCESTPISADSCAQDIKAKATLRPVAEREASKLISQLYLEQRKPAAERSKMEHPANLLAGWIGRVPGHVVSTTAETAFGSKCDLRMRQGNLELSPREFDEVLAVLRVRTPVNRQRVTLCPGKRKGKNELPQEYQHSAGGGTNKADMFLGAILRSTSGDGKSSFVDIANRTKITLEKSCQRNDSILPLTLNKKLLRLKHLFKCDQDEAANFANSEHDVRAKRRMDFLAEQSVDEEAVKGNGLAGSALVNPIVQEVTNLKADVQDSFIKLQMEFDKPQQRQRAECRTEDEPSMSKGKAHIHRNLSPVWVNHNNNHIHGKRQGEESEELGGEAVDKILVPSFKEQERFRRSLENAASMVFHSRTGLPLTSSPAPLRRGSSCFDFDISLNSVSSKRSALFQLNTPPSPNAVSLEEGDREVEIESTCDIEEITRRQSTSRNRPQSHALLGSFEESALNGRLEPFSTVHGFTAEIGASGTFCPKHEKLPVTVFFYTLGDNDKVSSPYLAHINLGKKGYQVPRMGTIQVTLLNPLGTVIKMFVVLYNLSDMPPRSHTFLRQRTLRDKTLRYLIHLRFMSSKSRRIYLHTDIRMIICRKSDVDTASNFSSESPKELRSYIHGPTNPKFSRRC